MGDINGAAPPRMGSAAKEGLNPDAFLTLSHPRGSLPSHYVSCLCIKQIPSQRLGRRGFGREEGMSGEHSVCQIQGVCPITD